MQVLCLCVLNLVRQKLVGQTCPERSWGRCGTFSVCVCVSFFCVCLPLMMMAVWVLCVGVSLWMWSWICRHCRCCVYVRVCSVVCATSVLDQQSCCYPINSAAVGHAGATQRTLGNSRFQRGHFHSTVSLQLAHCCTILCVCKNKCKRDSLDGHLIINYLITGLGQIRSKNNKFWNPNRDT